MNETIKNFFETLDFGEIQTNENLSVIPIYQRNGKSLKYVSLESAMKKNYVEVKEISISGSVPELFLINNSDYFVFILHGEELIGAKQNRTVNTSILVNKKTNLAIPVSCVERGRWNYKSEKFSPSKFIMPQFVKKISMRSTNESLKRNIGFRANQNEVWDEIDKISFEAKVSSKTAALYDVNKFLEKDLQQLISKFEFIPEQKGLAAFIDGKIVAIEFISRKSVLRNYYKRILKSFAFDALFSKKKTKNQEKETYYSQLTDEVNTIKQSKWDRFKSVGLGFDYRFDNTKSYGSILDVDNYVVTYSHCFEN